MKADPYSGKALRRGAWHFLSGKAASAVLTTVALLWAVRLLPVQQYAAYVTLVAAAEICLVIGTFGLPWMASRYLPEFKLQAAAAAVRQLCLRLLGVQVLALAVVALALAIGGGFYLRWAGLATQGDALILLLLFLVAEGTGRFVRDALMAALMLQRDARQSLISRQVVVLAGVGAIAALDRPTASALLLVEVIASAVATVWAVTRLFQATPSGAAAGSGTQPGWKMPRLGEQFGVAARMYLAHLFSLTYSPWVLVQFVQRSLGPEAAALFGFLRVLHDQLARYLPAMLFFSLLRPRWMADFVQHGLAELGRNVNLAGKLSLFALLPCIAVVMMAGTPLVALLSSGKFGHAGFVLLVFLLALVPYSQRQLLESVAVATGLAGRCVLASVLSALVLPIAWATGFLSAGLWAVVTVIGVGHLAFDAILYLGLRARVGYRLDAAGLGRLGLSLLTAVVAGELLRRGLTGIDTLPRDGDGHWPLVFSAGFSLGVYFLTAWVVKPFSVSERDRINALARRRVFVW